MTDTPLTDLLYKTCEEEGAVHEVDAKYYEAFLALDDERMTTIIKFIIMNYTREFNRIALESKEGEARGHVIRFIENVLSLMLRGILVIDEDGFISVMKPVGPAPDEKVKRKIEDKIEKSQGLMDKVLESMPSCALNQ